MSNQIVPLSVSINSADSSFSYSGVFWLTVPSANVVPFPGFTSAVPFIDQVMLAALRAGTLVEQKFTSGYFASGTTAVSVQSTSVTPPSLQTLFTTAQAALTAGASPLTGIIGSEYTGSAWAAVSATAVFDPNQKLVADVSWAAAAGLVPGIMSGRATGYVSTSATTLKPVMATAYTPQTTSVQRSLVSTSALDTSAGTGAQQVTVTGLTGAFAVVSEVVTMNGTTAVATVNSYQYIESMVVTQVGSTGSNQGVISIGTTTSGGTAWASIAINAGAGDNQTFYAHHYVPAGVTCYILSFEGASAAVLQTVIIGRTGNPSAANLPLIQIGPTMVTPSGDYREHDFQCALAVTGPDRIVFLAKPFAATASTAFGNFEYIQFGS